jgi:teichuronic acid biosynthesis glycosyltransferase TuaC
VHLGADLPATAAMPPAQPTLVTVGNLIERKRQADVIEAVARLARPFPQLRYEIVGDGPEREALAALAQRLGVASRVRFHGALAPEDALRVARSATLMAMPSVAEAFGVAYVEAMSAGVPAIGTRGEDGPEEIAAAGGGIALVNPRDPADLAQTIGSLLSDPGRLSALRGAARETVQRAFTWPQCGAQTLAAYREALDG